MSLTNEVESVSSNILDLVEQYNQNKDKIYKCLKEIDSLREKNQKLEKEIYKKCDHIWDREYDDAGPYSSITYYCRKCSLYR